MTFSPDVWLYIMLFAASLLAGFIDAMAGGGGLITLPALLAAGLPPQLALGTNKFQSSFGSFSASLHFIRKGHADWKTARTGVIFTFIGAAFGAWLVTMLPSGLLSKVIPFLLLGIVVYFIFSPDLGKLDKKPKIPHMQFFIPAGMVLGFYDGFFGPGTGSFWAVALMLICGYNMVKATAYTKIMNFTSNIASLLVFLVKGQVFFQIGIVMAIGQFTGARLGSSMVIKNGSRIIRPVFITAVLCIVGSLIYRNFFK